jgi:N-acetylglutamate synthase-like GNAT family acetyltransferase
MKIRKATEHDIDAIAQVYLHCFPNERNHKLWISSSFNSFPRAVYYVVEQENVIAGYILWSVKNGFRDATIVELEQVAVAPQHSGHGHGRRLIEDSFALFKTHVRETGHGVGAVMVTTSEGNYAESLYKSTLKVSRAALVQGYGGGNELILYNNAVAP